MNKKVIIITIIISILYIFFGNRYINGGHDIRANVPEYTAYSAKVLEIVEIVENDYSMGTESLKGKTIYFNAEVLNGELKGEILLATQDINPYIAMQPLEISEGDSILLSQLTYEEGTSDDLPWIMLEYSRTNAIYVLLAIFFVCLLIFGKGKGILTIISLSFTCLSIFLIYIPAILGGGNIYFWTIQICIFIIIMTLLLVNGANVKSLSAGIGCVGGVLVSGFFVVVMSEFLKLTGMINDESVYLTMLETETPIDLKAIIFGAIIIGAVGAIMDVAISISSSLSEIKAQNADISMKNLYISGITIGRDIIGTMTNTLILAYIGSSLSVVLLLVSTSPSLLYLMNTEMIIIEFLQSLVGSLGILLTLPLTALVSAYLYSRKSNPYIS